MSEVPNFIEDLTLWGFPSSPVQSYNFISKRGYERGYENTKKSYPNLIPNPRFELRISNGGTEMARTTNRLSSAKVKTKTPGMYADGGGLYLQVTLGVNQQIRRSWVFRFAINGRERLMGLGSYNDVSLIKARKAASAAREVRAQGKDPIIERESLRSAQAVANAKAMTFDQCAEAYITAHRAGW